MAGETRASSVRRVRIDDLDRRHQALRLRSATKEASLGASLLREGQRQPVLVSDGVESGRLVLLDGFKRVDLLQARGAVDVLAHVVTVDGPGALAAILAANAGQRGVSDLEEAWIVQALLRDHGLTQNQIASLLGRHKSWVSRRLSLVARLERQVQDDIRVGLLSATAGRELARLPRGNQGTASASVVRHELSSRQTASLVGVLLSSDPTQHSTILADPASHLPLPAEQATRPRDLRLTVAGNQVRSQLFRFHSAGNRVREVFLDHPPPSFPQRDVDLLSEFARPILAGAREALDSIGTLVARGGGD